jgi:hypothetical protein
MREDLMKVLVCAASKYGATGEIAQAVADVLAGRGCEVTVLPADKAGTVEEFDAQLGRDPRLGHRHRRRPAFLTSAREARDITRLPPGTRRGPQEPGSRTHPQWQTARAGKSVRLAAAILPSLKEHRFGNWRCVGDRGHSGRDWRAGSRVASAGRVGHR